MPTGVALELQKGLELCSLSKEGEDVYDVIEWAAEQPWSNGSVDMLGVSYLAISQCQVAPLHPPSLKAFCLSEGLSDAYSDLLFQGGVRRNEFVKLWGAGLKGVRLTDDMVAQHTKRPHRDDYWDSLVPDLSMIEVLMPALTRISNSSLHSRVTCRAFMHASSEEKYVNTYRSGKRATFYNEPAVLTQTSLL